MCMHMYEILNKDCSSKSRRKRRGGLGGWGRGEKYGRSRTKREKRKLRDVSGLIASTALTT